MGSDLSAVGGVFGVVIVDCMPMDMTSPTWGDTIKYSSGRGGHTGK